MKKEWIRRLINDEWRPRTMRTTCLKWEMKTEVWKIEEQDSRLINWINEENRRSLSDKNMNWLIEKTIQNREMRTTWKKELINWDNDEQGDTKTRHKRLLKRTNKMKNEGPKEGEWREWEVSLYEPVRH
jgi:hypothetical protein